MKVNSVLSGIQNSYITNKKAETKAVENRELSKAQELETFKKEIWNEINRMPRCSSINWSIQITDGGFKRMMEDAEYKQKIMSVLAEDARVGRPPITSSMCVIDENGLTGCSYNFGYGEEVFEAHSGDKDCFYKKRATKKIDYEELWKEEQLQKERQKERLDKNYFQSLTEHRRLIQKQMSQCLASYKAGTIVSDDFYSVREA